MRFNTNYYVTSIDADLDPTIGETVVVWVTITPMVGEPEYDEEVDRLNVPLGLELEFQKSPEEDDPSYGTFEVEFVACLSDNDRSSYLNEQFDLWVENDYGAIDSEVRFALEGDILPSILSPIDHMLDDAFKGLIPRVQFTHRDEVEEQSEESEESEESESSGNPEES